MRKILLSMLACVLAIAAKADVTDVLDYSISGATNQSYVDFSGKQVLSYAVYAGNASAGSSGDIIQLRSNNNNAGIVTTENKGGNVKKIVVDWNSATVDARILQIYASNTAYTAATDLYDSEKQGTLVGELSKGDGETTYTFESDYAYIGIRSKSGAMYINSISITWDGEADPNAGGGEEPAVTVAAPTFTPAGGTFSNTVSVALAQEDGATIHYTTDGTEPTAESTPYSAPIVLTATSETVTTTIKAIAIDGEGNTSNVVSATYKVNYVGPMAIGENQAGFDFVMNPWEHALSTNDNDETKAAGEFTTLTASDDATTLTIDNGSATTNARLWNNSTGGQFRIYTGATFTITAPAGKHISQIDFNFANTTSTITEGENTYKSSNATFAPADEATSDVTFTVTASTQINTILVTFGEGSGEEDLKGDVNGDGKVNISDVTALVNIILRKQ